MARRCTVCDHKHRADIDTALLGGEPSSTIALRFDDLSAPALRRHARGHLKISARAPVPQRQQAAAAIVTEVQQQVQPMHQYLQKLLSEINAAMERFKKDGDTRGLIVAVDNGRKLAETIMKAEGIALDAAEAINPTSHGIANNDAITAAVLGSIDDPETLDRVAAALAKLDKSVMPPVINQPANGRPL